MAIATVLSGLTLIAQENAGSTGTLSARQLYFKPKAATATPAKPVTRQSIASKPKPRPATPAAASSAAEPTPAAPDIAVSPAPPEPQSFRVLAHDLGLRYSIVQAGPDRKMTDEVDPEKEFVSGERFALRLEANEDAFLYVYSANNGELLFPNPAEANKIRASTAVMIPGRCASGDMDDCFQFDNTPGTEKLIVVLSSAPEAEIERVLRGQSGGGQKADAPKLLASNMEKVNSEMKLESRGIVRGATRKAAGGEENAVYIVQTGSAAKPRVITEILLRHK